MPDADHRLMAPPFLALRESHEAGTDSVQIWDLRVTQPNVAHLASSVTHSLEHFLAVELKSASPAVLNVAPMGCRTGFYLISLGIESYSQMADLLAGALASIATADTVPLANERDCGWAAEHSVDGAKHVAQWLLSRRTDWDVVVSPPQPETSGRVPA